MRICKLPLSSTRGEIEAEDEEEEEEHIMEWEKYEGRKE